VNSIAPLVILPACLKLFHEMGGEWYEKDLPNKPLGLLGHDTRYFGFNRKPISPPQEY
jgi:hypothetical protein